MVPYVGSHDVPRLASRADSGTNDAYNQWQEQGLPGQPGTDETYQAVLQAYGWLLTTPGAPLLYYGDEYGEYGGADPDNRHMYRDSSNWNHRESGLFENISALGQLRYDSIALKQGTYSTRYASPDVLIYDMSHEQQTMSIILNRGQATNYDGFDNYDLVRFGDSIISSTTTSIPANSVTVIEHDAITQPPARIDDSHCLIVHNFTMNETYFTTLDLTNTCDKALQYPGVNATTDNPLVEGFYGYTEWFYMMPSMSTYNMTWQLTLNETIPNGTEITLTFDAAILGCSDEDESQWHFCPTSTLSHTFILNSESANGNNSNQTHEPETVLGCTDSSATNFASIATEDDGSCEYPPEPIFGCTNITATNYDAEATQDDGTCQYDIEPVDQCDDIFCDACPAGWITLPAVEGDCCPSCQNPNESNQNNDANSGDESQVVTDSEESSSFTEFARTGLAIAVFCGLVVLLFTTMKKR